MHDGIHIALKAEEVSRILGVPITNTMLMSWMAMGILIIAAFFIGRNLTKIPSRVQTFFETLFSFLLDYMEEVLESRELARRFFPLITTLFMFILVGNLLGLLPGIGPITLNVGPDAEGVALDSHDPVHSEAVVETADEEHRVQLFHPMSTDLNITLALALIAFVSIEIAGFVHLGALHYLGKFFNFRSVIGFFVGIIELISELARLISFSFRLFGNMFAGKTLILVAMFFVPYLAPVPFMLYEVGVSLIQAAIFALLTLFFIKQALTPAH